MEPERKRRGFSRRGLIKSSAFGAFAAGGVYSLASARRLDVSEIGVRVAGLPASFEGVRVAFAADFHLGPHFPARKVRAAVESILGLGADLILLGGDYITRSSDYFAPAAEELSRLSAPLGVYAVPGNHDYWSNVTDWPAAAERMPLENMTNRGLCLRPSRGATARPSSPAASGRKAGPGAAQSPPAKGREGEGAGPGRAKEAHAAGAREAKTAIGAVKAEPETAEHPPARAGGGAGASDGARPAGAPGQGEDCIWLAGLDDLWAGNVDVDAAFAGAPEGAPRIVLCHNPYTADELPEGAASLILAGHTHGWQVYLPGITRHLIPPSIRRYRCGWYATKAGPMYVTRGVGLIAPPVRFWCRPEICLFTLRGKEGR